MKASDGSNNKTICFFCKKSGHMKKDCRKYATWKTEKNKVNKVMEYTSDEEQQALRVQNIRHLRKFRRNFVSE